MGEGNLIKALKDGINEVEKSKTELPKIVVKAVEVSNLLPIVK